MKIRVIEELGSVWKKNGRSDHRASIRPALLASVLAVTLASAQAQQPPSPQGRPEVVPSSPPARAAEKIRAFTGNWTNEKPPVGVTKPGVVPFRPDYEKKVEALAKLAVAGEEVPGNEPKCIPNGPAMDIGFGMRIFADAKQMVLISTGPRVRYIWLDGRKHTSDDFLFSNYSGESVAHWEGDTLVVDTIGLMPTNEIVFGISSNDDKMHMIERWRLISPTTLEIQTTIESDVALTKPWTYTRNYARREPSGDMQYCTSAVDRSRDGGFDLTPPAGGYLPPGVKE